ncbi:hypothetical protein E2562_019349 [Oryza meyeriana var. granulata]|uniref:Uncharacterized protein n=1 Tax=Oryza meyeriana var. granulata TaxID=110450 RepID=A0A6G1BLC2_9ORYZ|nr:hypothetical protein E2562_019349 [Oryza meyeriana var. granulata]
MASYRGVPLSRYGQGLQRTSSRGDQTSGAQWWPPSNVAQWQALVVLQDGRVRWPFRLAVGRLGLQLAGAGAMSEDAIGDEATNFGWTLYVM